MQDLKLYITVVCAASIAISLHRFCFRFLTKMSSFDFLSNMNILDFLNFLEALQDFNFNLQGRNFRLLNAQAWSSRWKSFFCSFWSNDQMPRRWLLLCRCTANLKLDYALSSIVWWTTTSAYKWQLNHNISTWIHENNYTNLTVNFSKLNLPKIFSSWWGKNVE